MTNLEKENISKSKINKIIIIILVVLFLGPLFYAIWLFNSDWRPASTSNYGTLIIPARPLDEFSLKTITGNDLSLDDIKHKWAMIIVGPANCQQPCKDNLYKMRQVHTLQAKHQPRLRRYMIVTDNDDLPALRSLLAREYPKMIVVNSPQKEIKKLVEQFKIDDNDDVPGLHRIYLMDPHGNLMMYYEQGTVGNDIYKDLKKLLRKSQIG